MSRLTNAAYLVFPGLLPLRRRVACGQASGAGQPSVLPQRANQSLIDSRPTGIASVPYVLLKGLPPL